jgi:hypothetical protein
MDILMTGFTSAHVDGNQRLKINGLAPLLIEYVRSEWNKKNDNVDVGILTTERMETLHEYDLAVVGIGSISSMFATQSYQTMLALYRLRKAGVPVITYVDDWKFGGYVKAFQNFYNDKDHAKRFLTKHKMGPKKAYQIDVANEYHELDTAIRWFAESDWPTTLICLFPWAKLDGISDLMQVSADRLVPVDPSELIPDFGNRPVHDNRKNKKWVMASLSNHEKWVEKLGVEWPVDHYGHRRSKQKRVTEDQIEAVYCKNWGVLSQSYEPAEYGWWRNRFVYAKRAGAILATDKELMPEGFDLLAPDEVEKLSFKELVQYRNEQHKAFKFWTPFEFGEAVDHAMADVITGNRKW